MRQPRRADIRLIFQPRNIVLIFFGIYFVLPALITLGITNLAIGFGDISAPQYRTAFIGALFASIVFIVIVVSLSWLVPGSVPRPRAGLPPLSVVSEPQMQVGWLLYVLGILPTLYLGTQMGGDMRSGLVSSAAGKIAFALSNAMIVGYICLSLGYLQRGKPARMIAVTLLFTALLLVLGGRGRVVWPIMGVFLAYVGYRYRTLPVLRILAFVSVMFVFGAYMDSLNALLDGDSGSGGLAILSLNALLLEVFVVKRNFDSIYNFFVIYHFDEISHSLAYLIDGPRQAFMGTYFPQILDRGVGFPATVPGTFWMVGGYLGLVVGAIGSGLFVGLLSRFYMRTRSTLSLAFQYYIFMLALNPGLSFFGNLQKIIAILVMMLPFHLLPALARAIARRAEPPIGAPRHALFNRDG